MKIAIDIQTTLGQPTGFGFYVSNLIENLQKEKGSHEIILLRPKTQKDFSTPQRFIWDQLTLPSLAKRAKVDLIHQPCFSTPFLFKGPVVITIHDIISILFPENIPFASRMFYSKWMPFAYRKATQIITISQSTKADIQSILKIPENKITVIPLAVDDRFCQHIAKDEVGAVSKKYGLPEKYILHVGTLEPRKNLQFLIETFAEVCKKEGNEDLSLVITGKKGWYFEGLFSKVEELNLGDKVFFTGYVDDKDKPALYRGAEIFSFPSLYEGFGLPPLEAMAAGVPVISSNTSSMPEVIGEAGILLSPTNQSAWVEAISKVHQSDDLQNQMREKNKIQVAKFSWAKSAQQTIEVYQKAYDQYHKT